MDIKTKLAYVEQHIKGISRHDDEDAAVRAAALSRIVDLVEAERAEMQIRVAARVEELMGS